MSLIPAEPGLYQAALDAIPLAAAVLDGDGCVLWVNERWRDSGHPGAVGQRYAAVCGEAMSAAVAAVLDGRERQVSLREASAGGTGIAGRGDGADDADKTGQIETSGGAGPLPAVPAVRWHDAQVRRLDVGGASAVLVTHDDVTEAHTLAKALRKSELRFGDVTEHATEVFWVFDWVNRVVEYVNPAFERVFGRPASDILADPAVWISSVHPEDRERVNAQFRMADQGPYESHYRIIRGDGTVRWLRDHGRPAMDDQGRVVRIVGIGEDITQRVMAEQQIERLYTETQMILDALPAYIWYKDAHNNILRVNRAVCESLGLPADQIEGQPAKKFYPDMAEKYFRDDREVLESGKPKLGIVELMDASVRDRRWVQVDKVPVRDDAGAVTGVIVIASDVTAQRAANLRHAVLEKAEEERAVFGRELHDGVGQQLTGLGLLVESLRRRANRGQPIEPASVGEVARAVAEAGTEVRRLISGLTPEPITFAEFPAALRNLAGNIETLFGVAATARVPRLSHTLKNESANHLLRIAQEAAHNAAKHAGASCIDITVQETADALTLTVRDDGQGLAAPLAFGEGADADLSGGTAGDGGIFGGTSGGGGTGRGLRIMRYRAEMIGGTLEVSGSPGQGTTVRCHVLLEKESWPPQSSQTPRHA